MFSIKAKVTSVEDTIIINITFIIFSSGVFISEGLVHSVTMKLVILCLCLASMASAAPPFSSHGFIKYSIPQPPGRQSVEVIPSFDANPLPSQDPLQPFQQDQPTQTNKSPSSRSWFCTPVCNWFNTSPI
ncbi:hypothetical protein PAMP_021104 [Pampus punctatissimus]